jgi:hypothetical protein
MNLIGQVYGKLTVIAKAPKYQGAIFWVVRCICGVGKHVRQNDLRSGRTRSCGCGIRESAIFRFTKHGSCGTREYKVWSNMKSRCLNPKVSHYKNYGGRGIKVCSRWVNSFSDFLADMGPIPADGYTIERINNDKNYTKSNCKWATRGEQANNQRVRKDAVVLELHGVKKTLPQWCKEKGLRHGTIYRRITVYGYTPEQALTYGHRVKHYERQQSKTKSSR